MAKVILVNMAGRDFTRIMVLALYTVEWKHLHFCTLPKFKKYHNYLAKNHHALNDAHRPAQEYKLELCAPNEPWQVHAADSVQVTHTAPIIKVN